MFYYKVENRKSPIQGEGLYTLDDIKKGSIIFYWGSDQDRIINEATYLKKRKDVSDNIFQKTSGRWVHNKFLHCKEWGPDCYMNHSYSPNILYYCGIGFAKKDIKKNEELFINFQYLLSDKDSACFTDIETNRQVIGLDNDECLKESSKELILLLNK